MTDSQILTLIIGITFPVLGIIGAIVAVLYNNKRMDDLRSNLNGRSDDLERHLNSRFDDLQKHIDAKIDIAFTHVELLLKLHEAEHHKK